MYALITGASSGIGLECAKLLAKKGYDLVLVARRIDRLLRLQEKFQTYYNIDVIIIPCDVSDMKQCKELYKQCRSLPIEIVINNAGFGRVGEFESIPLEDELAMIDTNVKAVHALTKLFLKCMDHGYILNVASIAGYQPIPLMATYGATKSYVVSFTKAVNYELKRKKKPVHVALLCPGPVDTEFDRIANVTYRLKHISAKQCAEAGLKGMFQKKKVIFPHPTTKLSSILSKFAPDAMILPAEYWIQNAKRR